MNFDANTLQLVRDYILAHPEEFSMATGIGWRRDGTPCLACIAGRAVLISAPEIANKLMTAYSRPNFNRQFKYSLWAPVKQVAIRELGITAQEAEGLFYSDHWPRAHFLRFQQATSRAAKAQIAAQVIDEFIASKKASE